MKGSAGSGKSVDTAQQYIARLMKDKGRNLLCVRKSEVTNRDSTFAELRSAINTMGVSNYWKETVSPLKLTCKNGNSIIFRGTYNDKQREKLKSITFTHGKLTDVWAEEMTELTQDDFEIIDDRLRGELPEGLFYQIKGTFNPVSSSHWIKKYFFDFKDNDTFTHHSTYLDNAFIDEGYRRRMMRRKEVDPEGYVIYGLGEWGESGGLILTNYQIEEVSKNHDDYDYVVNAQDFGYNHANAIGEVGFKDGNLYLMREIYEHERDPKELIQMAENCGFDKDILMYCDSANPDTIQMWNRAGFNAVPVKKGSGSVIDSIKSLKMRKIFIDPSCVNTIKEIGQWKWKKDSISGNYTDVPVNFFDDAMAMLRYSIEGELHPYESKIKMWKGGL